MELNLINANELVWHTLSKRTEVEQAIGKVNKNLVVYRKAQEHEISPWEKPKKGERYLVFAKTKEIRARFAQTQVKLVWFPDPINSNGWIGLEDDIPYWEVNGKDIPANRDLLND